MHSNAVWRALAVITVTALPALGFSACTSEEEGGSGNAPVPTSEGSQPTEAPVTGGGEGADSPQSAVLRLYEAIDSGDQNEFLDVLDPALRADPGNALLFTAFSVSFLGVGFSANAADIDFRDLHAEAVNTGGDWATVSVTARMRYAGTEKPLNEMHLVRKIAGRWYVSNEEQRTLSRAVTTSIRHIGPELYICCFQRGLLTVGPDGSLYIVDLARSPNSGARISRVSPSGNTNVLIQSGLDELIMGIVSTPNGIALLGRGQFYYLSDTGGLSPGREISLTGRPWMAATPDGVLYVLGEGQLARIDSDGNTRMAVVPYECCDDGLAVDETGRVFLVGGGSLTGPRSVYQVDDNLGMQLVFSGIPGGMSESGFAAMGGTFYYSVFEEGRVYMVRPGDDPVPIATSLNGPTAIAVADEKTIYVIEHYANRVVEITID